MKAPTKQSTGMAALAVALGAATLVCAPRVAPTERTLFYQAAGALVIVLAYVSRNAMINGEEVDPALLNARQRRVRVLLRAASYSAQAVFIAVVAYLIINEPTIDPSLMSGWTKLLVATLGFLVVAIAFAGRAYARLFLAR